MIAKKSKKKKTQQDEVTCDLSLDCRSFTSLEKVNREEVELVFLLPHTCIKRKLHKGRKMHAGHKKIMTTSNRTWKWCL